MAVLRSWSASWLASLCLVLISGAALAAPARIEAFDVERVAALEPGARLNFTVFGSAGAQVQVEIDGGRSVLPLRETEAGVYEGVYVIDAQDRIGAASRVLATLRGGDGGGTRGGEGGVVRAVLEEPLLLGQATTARRPEPPEALRSLPPPIEGRRDAPPVETSEPRAVAVPSYPAPAPAPAPAAGPVPTPWPPADARAAVAPQASQPPDAGVFPPGCRQCAIVESIRAVETPPARPPRTAVGSVLGAVFGESVAEHVDRHVARVNTAVDRAVNGRAQTPLPPTRYEVQLRLPGGQRLVRLYDAQPPFQPGDIVVLPESATRRGGGDLFVQQGG